MQRRRGPRTTVPAVLLAGLAVLASGCTGSAQQAGAPPASPVPVESDGSSAPAGPSAAPVGAPAGTPAASPGAVPEPSAPEPRPEQASDDGTWHAEVVRALPDALVLDKVELLHGEAAEAARAEDGQPDPGAEVPYVRNRNQRLRTLPVAADVDLQVVHCPQGGCALAPWPYADLVSGAPMPYGTPASPFTVTVVDGSVVALAEVYLS